jgi:hypothetical protein
LVAKPDSHEQHTRAEMAFMKRAGRGAQPVVENPVELLALAHSCLGVNGVKLARMLGVSPRTLHRWYAKRTMVSTMAMAAIVAPVHAVDAALAARIHAYLVHDAIQYGLPQPAPLPVPQVEAPPPEAKPEPPPLLPTPPAATDEMRVDSIVYAACKAIDAPSRAVLPVVFAAFRRAGELGLSVSDVERELEGRVKPAKKKGRE